MKITLLVNGKTTDTRIRTLIDEYRQRLIHYVPFEFVVLPDLKNAKSLTEEQVKTAEGEAILRYLTPSMDVLLLDEHGREFRSIEFADFLQRKMSAGRDLVLIIGGPYGLAQDIRKQADLLWSLSKLTFTHEIARLLLFEQLFRVLNLNAGGHYHNA